MVFAIAGLNLGSIRKAEDPIRDTQTNPIAYKQKMEEEKDGVKGPLMYHVKNHPKEAFFIDPPYEKEKELLTQEKQDKKESSSVADWWEEAPAEEPKTSQPEQAVTEAEVADGEMPVTEAATGEADSQGGEDKVAKGDDYWW